MTYTSNKIMFTKNFVTKFYQICFFIITYTNKNHSILFQQRSRHHQS